MGKPSIAGIDRVCAGCGEFKVASAFYKGRKFCMVCRRKAFAATDKARRMSPEYKAAHQHWNRTKPITEAAIARGRKHAARYIKMYPEKAVARRAVRDAIARGEIVRPACCERCGADPGLNRRGAPLLHGHHPDYSKPLEVDWLCVLCHAQEHHKSPDPARAALVQP